MRKLLVILALVGLTCVLSAWQPPAVKSASYFISAMTFHPTGDSSHNAILTCGWHDIGDCVCPDAESKALDWVAQGGSTAVWVRLWAFGGPTSNTWVARMNSYKPQTGCYRIESDVMRISDWALFGKVVALHSTRPASTQYANIYSRSSGTQNAAGVGSMVPQGQDNCQSEGPHTHQYYESGPNDDQSGKNGGMSTECQCCGCNDPYGIWITYEYYFKFWS